jgi:hypothetical protein
MKAIALFHKALQLRLRHYLDRDQAHRLIHRYIFPVRLENIIEYYWFLSIFSYPWQRTGIVLVYPNIDVGQVIVMGGIIYFLPCTKGLHSFFLSTSTGFGRHSDRR